MIYIGVEMIYIVSRIGLVVVLGLAVGTGLPQAYAQGPADRGLRNGRRAAVQERAEEIRPQVAEKTDAVSTGSGPATANMAAGIPASTMIRINLDSALDSAEHGEGHTFTGTLLADIGSGSECVATRGSKVHGKVVSARQPRNVAGQSMLELQLTSLMVGDQLRPIDSAKLVIESARTGGDTLRKTGGAAAIGGMADGSEGAEAGAKIGGAASLLSKGQTAALAAGTALEFRIGEPGSGVASQTSGTQTQPQEQSADRVRDRRDDRTNRRR